MQRRWFVAAIVAVVLTVIVAVPLHWRAQRQAAFYDVPPGGVADVLWVTIRHFDQHLFVRGHDRRKPILLFLPGGPGESFVPLAPIFTGALERDFVVAHIEMGGVGMSPDYLTAPTFDDLVADVGTMIDTLRSRYGHDTVYLAGHSFGSALALRAAQAWPEKVAAVATVGQTVDWRAGNRLAHAELVRRASAEHNTEALAQLATIPVDLVKPDDPTLIDFNAVKVLRHWQEHYGIMNIFAQHTARVHWAEYLAAPSHSLKQSCRLIWRGPCKLIADAPQWWHNWNLALRGIVAFDAARDVPKLAMPYLAIIGDDDWVTPEPLLVDYVAKLDAPAKRFVRLTGAQHYAFLDKPAEFQQALRLLLTPQDWPTP